MISGEEALQRILAATGFGPKELLPTPKAGGRFLIESIHAHIALPPFDNSAMDGFAVCFGKEQGQWRMVGEQAAGASPLPPLQPGECARIYTGAILPAGTDAVLMQEEATVHNGVVRAIDPPERGEFIRRAGSDVCRGQILFQKGDPVTPAAAGLIAAQGIAEVAVGARPRVRVLITGDELVTPGATLPPGGIYESNGVLLESLLRADGILDSTVSLVPDDLQLTRDALADGVRADFLILSGGMSVGARDFIKPALSELGITPNFWKVAVRPGKPFLFARAGECHILGLPGNPVSAFVTYLLFVRPTLRKWMGSRAPEPLLLQATTLEDLHNPGGRVHFFRGTLSGQGFRPRVSQESHQLGALAFCNALARVPAETHVAAGEKTDLIFYGH